MSELLYVATGLALVWSTNRAYDSGRGVLTDCEPDFCPRPHTLHTLLVITESNKHVGVRSTLSLSCFLLHLTPPPPPHPIPHTPVFISVQLIIKGNQLSLCKEITAGMKERTGGCKAGKMWPQTPQTPELKQRGQGILQYLKALLFTHTHTHHDDCTTQQKGRNGPSMSKVPLSNNRLHGNTNCNVSKSKSHVTFVSHCLLRIQSKLQWSTGRYGSESISKC